MKIAHEWGHGVALTSANFHSDTIVGLELHEGFADVIRQIVQKRAQPPGRP